MKKAKRWLLMTVALLMLVTHAAAVAPFKKVSIATSTKSPAASSSSAATATEASTAEAEEAKPSNVTASATPTKNSKLTGIPQIDYIWDPNLPRELNGYNLSTYPFHSSVPPADEIHFKCDGLHDGFYASIEHKCQVYHHCVYGIRHDFLCANFTAFDQKTFICHFASDVDCAGSQKYWSRNDALYMATTTSTTTTTTTEPPPTPRRRPVRPLRPLRRPLSHRNSDDYYYEDEQEYDDDYYDELVNRRRKQRPRQRKPMLDDYSDYEDNKRRRPASRNRFRDEEPESEDDYDTDRRKYDRSKSRNNNSERTGSDRRKIAARKPTTSAGRTDERRSFSDDRPLNGRKEIRPRPAVDDLADAPVDTPPRRLAGRRRINEKRTSPTPATAADFDDLDEYEKPKYPALDQEEAADEEAPPKIKTTPNEFVTPKAAPASVYARPRAPPRIARPVPVNEKKKFQYTAQKAATTASSLADAHPEDEEYYEDAEYDDAHLQRGHARRRVVEDSEDDVPATKRRNHNEAPPLARKPTRTALRKPVTDKKSLPVDDADYDSAVIASNERLDGRGSARKRPFTGRTRGAARDTDDVDFVDDDYDERQQRPAHRLRPKSAARKGAKKPRLPLAEEEEEDVNEPVAEPEQPVRSRPGVLLARRKPVTARLRQPTPPAAVAEAALDAEPKLEADAADADADAEGDAELPIASSKSLPTTASGRTASVRVVKRPFLPSRGGSPYLPRGLQPVGVALKPLGGRAPHTTDSTPIDMGSTISGVRLLEHGAPILRDSGAERTQSARTTLPPRSAIPVTHTRSDAPPQQSKISLDELYETDYDVTLNDALNPTLKPLSPLPSSNHQNRNYAAGAGAGAGAYASAPAATHTFVNNNQSPAIYHNNNDNNYQLQQQQLQSQQQLQQLQRQQQQHHSNAYQSVPHQPPSQPLSQSLTQPLSQSQTHHQQLHTQSPPQAQQQQQQQRNNYNSDSYFSSTDIRRRAVIAAPPPRTSQSQTDYRGVGTRIAQHFYDDFEY